MKLEIATVYKVNPLTGVHQITLDTSSDVPLHAIPLSQSGNISLIGAKDMTTYEIGSRVLVAIDSKATGEQSVLDVGLILGSAKMIANAPEDSLYDVLNNVLINAKPYISTEQDITLEPTTSEMKADYSYNKAVDVLPGEFAKLNSLQGGIFFNEFMTYLGSNDRAKIESFTFDNTLRITADTLQYRQLTKESWSYTDQGKSISVAQIGRDIKESAGILKKSDDVLYPKNEDNPQPFMDIAKQGFMNNQVLEGSLVEGKVAQHLIPPKKTDKGLYNSEEKAPAVLSVVEGELGEYSITAAKSVVIEKNVIIPAVHLLLNAVCDRQKDLEDLEDIEEIPDIKDCFGKLGIERYYDKELANKFKELRRRAKDWSIPETRDAIIEALSSAGIEYEELELDTIGNRAEYPKPNPLKVESETLNGRDIKKLVALSSALKLHEDGSTSFYGGYGEEIKMSRGNVYITCPGDVYQLPGRSNIHISGNHSIIKGKGNIELEGKNIDVLGANDVQIVAAALDDEGRHRGSLLLENLADGSISYDEEEYGISNGGIFIKSKQLVTMSETLDLNSPEGKGVLNINQKQINSVSKTLDVSLVDNGLFKLTVAGSGNKGSGMYMGANSFEILSKNYNIGANSFFIKSSSGSHTVMQRDGESKSVTCGGSGSLSVRLDGNVVAKQLGLLSKVSEDMEGDGYSRIMSDDSPEQQPGGNPLPLLGGDYISDMMKAIVKDYDKPVTILADYYQSILLPMFFWQDKLKTQDTWETCIEIKEKQTFPGKEEAKEAFYCISDNDEIEKKPLTDYIINK